MFVEQSDKKLLDLNKIDTAYEWIEIYFKRGGKKYIAEEQNEKYIQKLYCFSIENLISTKIIELI